MTVAEITDIGENISALKLLGAELDKEMWKQSNGAYVSLVEEKFQSIADGLNANPESDLSNRFYYTLEHMPESIKKLWDAWIDKTGTTLPEVKAMFGGVRPWLVVADCG